MNDITNYKYDVVYKLASSNNEFNIATDVIPKQLPTEKLNDSYGYYTDTINCKITYSNTLTLRVYRRIGDSTERTKVYEDTNFKFLTFNYRRSFIVDEAEVGEKVLFQILNLNDEEHIPIKYAVAGLDYDIATDKEQHVDIYIKRAADSDSMYQMLFRCISASSTGELVKAYIDSLEQGVEYTIRVYHYETGQTLEFPITGLYDFKSGNNPIYNDYIVVFSDYKIKYVDIKKEMYSTIVDDNNDMFFPLVGDTESLLNPNLKLKKVGDVNNYINGIGPGNNSNKLGLGISKTGYVEFPNDINDPTHAINYNNFFPTVDTDRYVYFFNLYLPSGATENYDIPLLSFIDNNVVRNIKININDYTITTFNGTKVAYISDSNYYPLTEVWLSVTIVTNSKGEIGAIFVNNANGENTAQTLKGQISYVTDPPVAMCLPVNRDSNFKYSRRYNIFNAVITPDVEPGVCFRYKYMYYKTIDSKYASEDFDWSYGEPILINPVEGNSYIDVDLELKANEHRGDYVLVAIELIGISGESPITATMSLESAYYINEPNGAQIDIRSNILTNELRKTDIRRPFIDYISTYENTIYLEKFAIGVDKIRYPLSGLRASNISCKVNNLNSDASIRIGAINTRQYALASVGKRVVHNIAEDDISLPYNYIPEDMYNQIMHDLGANYPRLIGKSNIEVTNSRSYTITGVTKLIAKDYFVSNINKHISNYDLYAYGIYNNRRNLDYKPAISIQPVNLTGNSFYIDFETTTKEGFEAQLDLFKSMFYANNIGEYDKLSGGTHSQLVYADFDERCIVIEAHGDKYTGDVPALSYDTLDKGYGLPLNILDVPNNYIGGVIKQPNIRVGGAITYYRYVNFGIYEFYIKLPKGFDGATVGIKLSYDEECVKTLNPTKFSNVIGGSLNYDYNKVVEDTDMGLAINMNNNIDATVTSKPSNVYINKLPTEDSSNWYLPAITELQMLIVNIAGVYKLYKIDWETTSTIITDRLSGLTIYEPAEPQCYLTTKELVWTYIKDVETIDASATNIRFKSSVTNAEEINPINDNIASLSPRFFEMYNSVDSDVVAIIGNNQFTTLADDTYHRYELYVQPDGISLHIDGILVGVIKNVISFTNLKFSIGCWFPSVDVNDTEAIAKQEYGTYAGAKADWDVKHIKIRSIGYTRKDFVNYNEPETNPFGGVRAIKSINN